MWADGKNSNNSDRDEFDWGVNCWCSSYTFMACLAWVFPWISHSIKHSPMRISYLMKYRLWDLLTYSLINAINALISASQKN